MSPKPKELETTDTLYYSFTRAPPQRKRQWHTYDGVAVFIVKVSIVTLLPTVVDAHASKAHSADGRLSIHNACDGFGHRQHLLLRYVQLIAVP
jgi:hypothetical protein